MSTMSYRLLGRKQSWPELVTTLRSAAHKASFELTQNLLHDGPPTSLSWGPANAKTLLGHLDGLRD